MITTLFSAVVVSNSDREIISLTMKNFHLVAAAAAAVSALCVATLTPTLLA